MTAVDKMAACKFQETLFITVICLQILFCAASTDSKLTRKLHTQDLGKDLCKNETGDIQLIHTQADGAKDTLHYLFSTQGIPTILVVRTDLGGQIQLNCAKFASGNVTLMQDSISFTGRHYAYSLMFNRLFEYNDTDDKANLDKVPYNNETWKVYDLKDLPWEPLSETTDFTNDKVVFKLQDSPMSPISFNENGSLSLSMEVVGAYVRETLLPHLEYNANMTHIELTFDNINTTFSAARFAIEMTLVSTDGVQNITFRNKMALNKQPYIDDEHSPGVFEMIDWTAQGLTQDWSGFLQFKPVCYTNPKRSLNDATKAVYYTLVRPPNDTNAEESLAYAYFGEEMYVGNYSITMTNVSFGLSKDKFYTFTRYTVWSASVGFGTPPSDQISALIMIILSVGLGLPIVLIAFGSIGICIRKRLRGQSPYQEISSSTPIIN